MADKKTSARKPFNFGDSPLVKQTEQTVMTGYEAVAQKEQGGGEAPAATADHHHTLEPMGNITAPATLRDQEPTQNINIPIPLSLHTRLGIIKAQKRQNIKDMVVQAIELWVDVQEGKTKVSQVNG